MKIANDRGPRGTNGEDGRVTVIPTPAVTVSPGRVRHPTENPCNPGTNTATTLRGAFPGGLARTWQPIRLTQGDPPAGCALFSVPASSNSDDRSHSCIFIFTDIFVLFLFFSCSFPSVFPPSLLHPASLPVYLFTPWPLFPLLFSELGHKQAIT